MERHVSLPRPHYAAVRNGVRCERKSPNTRGELRPLPRASASPRRAAGAAEGGCAGHRVQLHRASNAAAPALMQHPAQYFAPGSPPPAGRHGPGLKPGLVKSPLPERAPAHDEPGPQGRHPGWASQKSLTLPPKSGTVLCLAGFTGHPVEPPIAMPSSPSAPSSVSPAVAGAPLIWTNILLFLLTFLAAAVLVPWYGLTHGFSAAAWVLFGVFLVANEMSITAGYHRLWAHRTYDAHWSVRLLFVIFGSMALQNTAWAWCSGHRRHHLNVDDVDRDPYSALRGFWFSHIGWMVREYPSGHEDFSNIPDLRRDRLLAFQHRHYVTLVLATNFGLPLLAGWLVGDLWGTFLLAGVLRLVLSHHFTFFINSLAHMWGERPYTEENTARDNPVLAVLTFGEGYHNFHHNFAHDYRNGVRWWQWDPTKWLIAGLQLVGLTRRLKRTPVFQIQRA